MKKRMMCLCLCLCAMMHALPALAEDDALHVLNDRWFAVEAYQAQYPDRPVEVTNPEYDDNGIDTNLETLLRTTDWDVACIDTDDFSLQQLDEAGLLEDITGDFGEEAFYPAVRNAVTVSGRMLGVPTQAWCLGTAYTMYWLGEDTYGLSQRLGLTAGDEPHNYGELYALAEKYFSLDPEQRRGTYFLYNALEGNEASFLLSGFISQYAAEFADAEGHVDYDTDVFRDGVAQIEALAALLREHAKPLYEPGSTSLHMLVGDASNHPLGNTTPFYLGETPNVPMKLEVWVVRAGTDKRDAALDLIRATMAEGAPHFAPALYEDFDYDALRRASYDALIAGQIQQGEEQSVIDRLVSLRDAGDDSQYYSSEEIARYREHVAPYLTFPRCGRVASWSLATRYLDGALDLEGLIAALSE